MKKTRIVHCMEEDYDVYIGRGKCPKTGKIGIWGNPFSHKISKYAEYKVSSLKEALEKYEEWVLARPWYIAAAKEQLKGKVLGCWCKSKSNSNAPCHGDILIKLIEEEKSELYADL